MERTAHQPTLLRLRVGQGIAFLIENGFIRSSDPKDIARFLLHADGQAKGQPFSSSSKWVSRKRRPYTLRLEVELLDALEQFNSGVNTPDGTSADDPSRFESAKLRKTTLLEGIKKKLGRRSSSPGERAPSR
jgi:hypothetical protein